MRGHPLVKCNKAMYYYQNKMHDESFFFFLFTLVPAPPHYHNKLTVQIAYRVAEGVIFALGLGKREAISRA
jgi:hypothetical protein